MPNLTEAFEAWWKANVMRKDIPFSEEVRYSDSKIVWLAACAWQKEQDATIAEAASQTTSFTVGYPVEEGFFHQACHHIAVAIREQA